MIIESCFFRLHPIRDPFTEQNPSKRRSLCSTMPSHALFAAQHALHLIALTWEHPCGYAVAPAMPWGLGYSSLTVRMRLTWLKSASIDGTIDSLRMGSQKFKILTMEVSQKMKFVLMAENRGRENLKFVPTDPQFPPHIIVDARSHEAKLIVTNKETLHTSERTISMRILMEAPQPTIIHSLMVTYQQCMRELKWK